MPHGMVTCTEQNSFTQSGNSFSTNFSTQSGANHRCKKRFYIVFYSCHVSKNVLTFSYFATFLYYKKRQRKCNLKQYFFDILHRWLRYLKRKGNAIRGEIIPCRKHRVTDCTDCYGTAHWATTNFFYHVSDVFLFISVGFFLHFKTSFFKCSPTFVYMFTFRFLRLRAVVGALKPHCPAQCELLLLHVIAGCWSKIE